MINCEIKLISTWSNDFALANIAARAAGNNNDPPVIAAPERLTFQKTDKKMYVSVVTLQKENDF